MEFRKFDSLENTYNQKFKNYVVEQGFSEELWIVTEKIDGANFCFYYDGKTLRIASRNQFVDGTFFACQEVVERYGPALRRLYTDICGGEGLLQVYGELYGPRILGRVNYGEKDFCVFDILIDGVPIFKDTALSAATRAGFKISPVLMVGSFEDAWNWQHEFQSKLTPDGFDGENAAEGIVIEPIEPGWFKSGKRVYFKHKAEAFLEKKIPKKPKEATKLPDDVLVVRDAIGLLLTESRVCSVLSKLGGITEKDFGKLLGLTVADAIEEWERENEKSIEDVLEFNVKALKKSLSAEAANVVRPVFVKNI